MAIKSLKVAILAAQSHISIRFANDFDYFNDLKHCRDFMTGRNLVKLAEKIQNDLISNLDGSKGIPIQSIAMAMCKLTNRPYVSMWYNPYWRYDDKPFGAVGSGARYVQEYFETRNLENLDATKAQAIALSAVRRAKTKDLYSSGRITIYHVTPAGRSKVKFFDA